jgi:hypothetical protein
MKKGNLAVVKKEDAANEKLTPEQLDEINMELQMTRSVLDLLASVDPNAEIDIKTVSHIGLYLGEKVDRVFKILNGESKR